MSALPLVATNKLRRRIWSLKPKTRHWRIDTLPSQVCETFILLRPPLRTAHSDYLWLARGKEYANNLNQIFHVEQEIQSAWGGQ